MRSWLLIGFTLAFSSGAVTAQLMLPDPVASPSVEVTPPAPITPQEKLSPKASADSSRVAGDLKGVLGWTLQLQLAGEEKIIRQGQLQSSEFVKSWNVDPEAVVVSMRAQRIGVALRRELDRVYNQVDSRKAVAARFVKGVQGWEGREVSSWKVDRAATDADVMAALQGRANVAGITYRVQRSSPTVDDLVGKGIVEHLATGKTSFRGSPSFRVTNVVRGGQLLDGLIFSPGKVLSFNQAIGPTTRARGFVPGYVISGGKLALEDGGGICQVSTTLLRAAYQAGLPLKERNQHSHVVHYYDPVGYEATVYAPQLDLKFLNDTTSPIMIQASWSERDQWLQFDLFGTLDGRQVKVAEPVLSGWTGYGKTTYTADSRVRLGGARLVDRAMRGVTAVVRRTVVMPDGKVKRDELRSKYRPWGAVYAVNPNDYRLRR